MTVPGGPPRIVLVTKPVARPIAGAPVFAGAVMGAAEGRRPNLLWLDLNIVGQRLPQMYGEDEVEDATPELLDAHRLCRPCSGYGLLAVRSSLDDPGTPCEACRGSGSTQWRTEIARLEDGGIEVRIAQTTEAE